MKFTVSTAEAFVDVWSTLRLSSRQPLSDIDNCGYTPSRELPTTPTAPLIQTSPLAVHAVQESNGRRRSTEGRIENDPKAKCLKNIPQTIDEGIENFKQGKSLN